MDVCLKSTFVPEHQENVNINTTLFIFAQVVSENVGTKKLSVIYYKKNEDDVDCIFDGVKDYLLKTLDIELCIEFLDKDAFYSTKMLSERPDLVYVDDFLNDTEISHAMTNTIVPSTFIITRGEYTGNLTKDLYYPLYSAGSGKDKLVLARWCMLELWRNSQPSISVLNIKSEDDLEVARQTARRSFVQRPAILVTKYPDELGLKKVIKRDRSKAGQEYVHVVFTNTDVAENVLKQRTKTNLVYHVLNDGIWGGEYYVPLKNI